MKVQEINANQFNQIAKKVFVPLTKVQWESLAPNWATKPNRNTTYFSSVTGEFTCYSKKLRTLGCNEFKATQYGSVIKVSIYLDATNSRSVKYYQIVE